jgi:hypothetical protein
LSGEARQIIGSAEQTVERLQMDRLAALPQDGSASEPQALIALYAEVAGLALDGDDVAIVREGT